MQTRIRNAGIRATLALAATLLCGCAAQPSAVVTGETAASALIYTAGRPVMKPAPAESAVPQVTVQGAAPAGLIGTIYFDFDRYDIKPEYRDVLQKHARMLRDNPSARIVIEGHTDQFGSAEYNLALGNRRAESVRRALKLLGGQEPQMEAISFGETQPAEPGEDEKSRALNRRAEIRRER